MSHGYRIISDFTVGCDTTGMENPKMSNISWACKAGYDHISNNYDHRCHIHTCKPDMMSLVEMPGCGEREIYIKK